MLLTNRIPAHHVYWGERGRADPEAVLYVALGDSAALGLGASKPQRGYVGIVAAEIARITGKRVRVRNLAIDGATCAVVLADELHRIPKETALVCTLDVGANDIWSFEPERFRDEFDRICAALPAGAIVADLPSFSPLPVARRVDAANRIVHEVVAAHGLTLAPAATRRHGGAARSSRSATRPATCSTRTTAGIACGRRRSSPPCGSGSPPSRRTGNLTVARWSVRAPYWGMGQTDLSVLPSSAAVTHPRTPDTRPAAGLPSGAEHLAAGDQPPLMPSAVPSTRGATHARHARSAAGDPGGHPRGAHDRGPCRAAARRGGDDAVGDGRPPDSRARLELIRVAPISGRRTAVGRPVQVHVRCRRPPGRSDVVAS